MLIAASPIVALSADDFPANLSFSSTELVLNGVGKRKKAFLTLYNAGLYLPAKSDSASDIIAADSDMAVRIRIVSGLISSKRMDDALADGFEQSTGGDTAPIADEITAFRAAFSDEISKGDQFDLTYTSADGVQVLKNGELKATVTGLPFKQALFGIWLSDNPIQKSLKAAMLGQ